MSHAVGRNVDGLVTHAEGTHVTKEPGRRNLSDEMLQRQVQERENGNQRGECMCAY